MSDACSPFSCGSSTMSSSESSSLGRPRSSKNGRDPNSKKRKIFYDKTQRIPNEVQAWKIDTAEDLGIFYNKEFHKYPSDVLDMIQKNSTCSELKSSPCLAELADQLKECLDFDNIDIGEHDKIKGLMDRSYRIAILQSLANVKHRICKRLEEPKFAGSGREAAMMSCAVEFIEQVAYLLNREVMQLSGLGQVPTAIYRNLISSFERMCFLFPRTGDEFKCRRSINGVEVTSTPDIRLGKYLEDNLVLDQCQCTALVSVEEKKLIQKVDLWDREVSSDANSPALLHVLGAEGREILGQHAGELLMDYDQSLVPYMPGMIVTGTKVFFTLLEMNADHIYKLYNNRKLTKSENRATIYYSEPLDLLIKLERDLLIDSFMRLNNIKRLNVP